MKNNHFDSDKKIINCWIFTEKKNENQLKKREKQLEKKTYLPYISVRFETAYNEI